jgi:hypothetical protein
MQLTKCWLLITRAQWGGLRSARSPLCLKDQPQAASCCESAVFGEVSQPVENFEFYVLFADFGQEFAKWL